MCLSIGSNIKTNKKATQLSIARIYPGMVIARDVYARNDQLVMNKGIILDSTKITKLMFYAIESIYVYKTDDSDFEIELHDDKISSTMEFRQFLKRYEDTIMSVKDYLNGMIENNTVINKDEVMQSINGILRTSKNKLHLLSMLYCIRNYDDSTYMHSINVALICNVFSDWLHFSKEDKELLTLSGMLHDIGKILIPKRILNKPGRLTDHEYDIIKMHTIKGYDIVKDKDLDERVKGAILNHHERYDGSGYNSHIIGDDIDAFAMVVAIADVYDAMTSSRVYRGPLCPFDVIKSFEMDGYQIYDPKILMPLIQNIAESYNNHVVKLNNQKEAEIIVINRTALSQPIVKLSDNSIIDLSKTKDIQILEVL